MNVPPRWPVYVWNNETDVKATTHVHSLQQQSSWTGSPGPAEKNEELWDSNPRCEKDIEVSRPARLSPVQSTSSPATQRLMERKKKVSRGEEAKRGFAFYESSFMSTTSSHRRFHVAGPCTTRASKQAAMGTTSTVSRTTSTYNAVCRVS